MSAAYQGAARPRVLVCGLTEAEVETVRPLAGSLMVLGDREQLGDVHWEEHDVLVVTHADFNDHSMLSHRRVVFAREVEPLPAESGRFVGSSGSLGPTITRSRTQHKPAQDFTVTAYAREAGIEPLITRSCIPEGGGAYTGFRTPVHPEHEETVLVHEHLSSPLALAALLESDSIGPVDHHDQFRWNESVLWLPDIARSHVSDWLRFAFAHWREADPDAFPEDAEWKAADAWASPEESAARQALSAFEAEEAKRLAEAERARTEIVGAIEAAAEQGERWRSLLTATGDELVESVKEALEGLGFNVVDSDALPENKSKKREDLRVSDGDWIALVEVKGYGGGAKSNDLQQITGASAVFCATKGQVPDALWYVVNAFREDDPAQRSLALIGRDDDLTSFAENHNGCLIDTRDLFRLRQRFAAGQISASDARAELKAASARYTSPSRVKA